MRTGGAGLRLVMLAVVCGAGAEDGLSGAEGTLGWGRGRMGRQQGLLVFEMRNDCSKKGK